MTHTPNTSALPLADATRIGLMPQRTQQLMDVLRERVAQQHRIVEPFAHDPDGGMPMKLFDPREVPAMESGGGGLMSTA